METWTLSDDEPAGTEYTERIIMIGADLPPWGTRSIIKVHVASDVPLHRITEFVSFLQGRGDQQPIPDSSDSEEEENQNQKVKSTKSKVSSVSLKETKGKEPCLNGDVVMGKKEVRRSQRDNVYSEIQENRVQEEIRMRLETVQDNTLPLRREEAEIINSLRQVKRSAVNQPLPPEKRELPSSETPEESETPNSSEESDTEEVIQEKLDPAMQRISAMKEDIDEIALEDLYQARHRQHGSKYCACEQCLANQDGRHWKTHLTQEEGGSVNEKEKRASVSGAGIKLNQTESIESISDDGESCV